MEMQRASFRLGVLVVRLVVMLVVQLVVVLVVR